MGLYPYSGLFACESFVTMNAFFVCVVFTTIHAVCNAFTCSLPSRNLVVLHMTGDAGEPLPIRRAILGSTALATTQLLFSSFFAPTGFTRIPTQFIAALGNPVSNSGVNAKEWGLWRDDPGPRGVYLKDYADSIAAKNGYSPDGWIFNPNDWWLEEHGIIMPPPDFPIPPGRYLVTGGRLITSPLTIHDDGRWELEKGTLYDVTHLPCRSARYMPVDGSPKGSPETAYLSDFPVFPGAEMPAVRGCSKQDYAVLFIIGKSG
jgi:hypothetical protein